MLRFFRTIRNKLFMEGKVSRYLVYAAGEIVLVVAGILIALQVNNLNEERKTEAQEQYYLETLHIQLRMDSVSIHRGYDFQTILSQELDSLRNILSSSTTNSSIITLPKYITLQSPFNSNALVIEELVNSMQIRILDNESLRNQLAAYHKEIELQHTFTVRGDAKMDHFNDFLTEHSPYYGNYYRLELAGVDRDVLQHLFWFTEMSQSSQRRFFAKMMVLVNETLQTLDGELQ